MKSAVPKVEPLKSWPTVQRYLKELTAYAEMQQDDVQALRQYVETGKIGGFSLLSNQHEWAPRPSRSSYMYGGLHVVSRLRLIAGCASISSSVSCVPPQLAVSASYRELSCALEFLLESEFPNLHGKKRCGMSIGEACWIGLAASTGDMEMADRWAALLVRAVGQGFVRDADFKGLNHFILRLWCAARGRAYPDQKYPRYDVSEGVLEMWDTSDVETLGQWLVELCNQHTRLTAKRDFMDFSNEFSHIPVEVLMLFRLREQIGLSNPEVNHPIMTFPWSRLWPASAVQPDALLAGICQRLEQDEGISLDQLYRQFLA